MSTVKKKHSFKKLGWMALSILTGLMLVASVSYYAAFLHGKHATSAAANGQHITLAMATGKIVEGKLKVLPQQLPKEDTPTASQADEAPPEDATEVVGSEIKVPEKKTKEAVNVKAAPVVEKTTKPTKAPSGVASPVAKRTGEPVKIAILIGGLGLSKSSTERAVALPGKVSLGLSPYSLDIKTWVERATKKGHEVFMNLPMEATESPLDDPGSFALVTSLDAGNNLKRLDWVLSRAEGYKGVYSDPSEKFTESESSIRPILKSLKRRNLSFIYGAGYSNTSFLKIAKDTAQPMVVNDVVIDTKISADRIKDSLTALEVSAEKNGYALGIGSPYPITIKILEEWIATLDSKGIVIVPVSALLEKKAKNNPKVVSN